jgi:hypothetical protein
MEMQTGSINNHICQQNFFALAAPMYWWDWLVVTALMVLYNEGCHVSSISPN